MLRFEPITKEAIQSFLPYLSCGNGRFCDYTPVNLYIWKGYFYHGYAICDDMLFLQLLDEDGRIIYAPPMGNGDWIRAVRTLQAHCDELGESLCLSIVSKEQLVELQAVFDDVTVYEPERQWADYLYDAKRMAAYEGADYAKQRNHVRRFERQYPDWRVEWLSLSHLPSLRSFLQAFPVIRQKQSALAVEEIARTEKALSVMKELALVGVVLYVGETLVGFSAGCRVADTLYVNFEKADTSYDGVYQMLVKLFATAFADDSVRFINREEDCGDEGLRKSKLAYHPIALLDKYMVLIPS